MIFIGIATWQIIKLVNHRSKSEKEHKEKLSDIEKNGKYSIANTAEEVDQTSNFSTNGVRKVYKEVQVNFTFKGETHDAYFSMADYSYIIPQRYFIEFSEKNIDNTRLYHIVVPDSIESAPTDGWDYIPGSRFSVARIDSVNTEKSVVFLSFHYKTKNYNESVFCDFINKDDIGKKYYISFYPVKPFVDIDVNIYQSPVFDSAKTGTAVPEGGWSKLPVN
ncbi:MAG TPA: hypothetical protein VK890_11675 [Bacteroidia bacterium]|nr:hypothetical protein [Bacteroidia bacterium]